MEFEGRIMRILPQRSGTSQRTGNDWVAQPFVFEYFENPTDRWSDKVLLETYNKDIIAKMKEGMKCRCGFGHNINDWNGKTYNELNLYKFELIGDEKAPQEPPKEEVRADTPQPPKEGEKADDLPF